MGLLDDKVAIITGAGRGIGRATALLFAKEGCKLVLNDSGVAADGGLAGADATLAEQLADEINRSGGEAFASNDDISRAGSATALVNSAKNHFGRLDVLVNNAGILRDKTFLKLSLEDFDAVIAVHLRGTLLCSQAAAKEMTKDGGSIINTTSVSGLLGNFGQSNYSAAKAAIYGLTRTCSIELQRYGIRVNAVAPIAKTRLTEDLPMFENVQSMTPEHVAPVNLFLASDLSRETSGVVVSVAGGRLSTFRVVESAGKFKESDAGVWTAEEIAEHFGSLGAPGARG